MKVYLGTNAQIAPGKESFRDHACADRRLRPAKSGWTRNCPAVQYPKQRGNHTALASTSFPRKRESIVLTWTPAFAGETTSMLPFLTIPLFS